MAPQELRDIAKSGATYSLAKCTMPVALLEVDSDQAEPDQNTIQVLLASFAVEVHRNRELRATIAREKYDEFIDYMEKNPEVSEYAAWTHILIPGDVRVWGGQHRLLAAQLFAAQSPQGQLDQVWDVDLYDLDG